VNNKETGGKVFTNNAGTAEHLFSLRETPSIHGTRPLKH